MPSTVTQNRPRNVAPALTPDDLTGPQHVGHAVNRAVAQASRTQHRNVVKMHDALDRQIKLAAERGGEAGIEYLSRCAAVIERNRQNLASWAADQGDLYSFMVGVTVGDLDAADLRLTKAAQRIRGELS